MAYHRQVMVQIHFLCKGHVECPFFVQKRGDTMGKRIQDLTLEERQEAN